MARTLVTLSRIHRLRDLPVCHLPRVLIFHHPSDPLARSTQDFYARRFSLLGLDATEALGATERICRSLRRAETTIRVLASISLIALTWLFFGFYDLSIALPAVPWHPSNETSQLRQSSQKRLVIVATLICSKVRYAS